MKIITFMLDNDVEAAEKFYKSPLYYAFYRYNEAKKTIDDSFLQQKPSIALYFKLPTEQQQKIIQLHESTKSLFYNSQVISGQNLDTIKNFSPEVQKEFFSNQNIVLIDDAANTLCEKRTIQSTMLGSIVGLIIGTGISLVVTTTTDNTNKWTSLLMILPIIFTSIIGGIYGGKYFVKQAQQSFKPIDKELVHKELEEIAID